MATLAEKQFERRFRLLINKVFEKTHWLEQAVKLGANPVFLGHGLIKFFNGDDSPIYLAVMSMDMSGDLERISPLLESLRSPEPESYKKDVAEYSPKGSNITLNIWESLKKDELTRVTDFKKLFNEDSDTLRTAVLYYNGGKGKVSRFVFKNHKSWKRSYTVPLRFCHYPSYYPDTGRTLDWTFTLHSNERVNNVPPYASRSSGEDSSDFVEDHGIEVLEDLHSSGKLNQEAVEIIQLLQRMKGLRRK